MGMAEKIILDTGLDLMEYEVVSLPRGHNYIIGYVYGQSIDMF